MEHYIVGWDLFKETLSKPFSGILKYEFNCIKDLWDRNVDVYRPTFEGTYGTCSFEFALDCETLVIEYLFKKFPWNDPLNWVLE